MAKYKNNLGGDDAFRALADPTRRILRMLGSREMTAGEIGRHFDISGPSMSHHFAVLKNADLVAARREGQQIYYSLNTTVFQDVLALLMGLLPGGGGVKGKPKETAHDRPTVARGVPAGRRRRRGVHNLGDAGAPAAAADPLEPSR